MMGVAVQFVAECYSVYLLNVDLTQASFNPYALKCVAV